MLVPVALAIIEELNDNLHGDCSGNSANDASLNSATSKEYNQLDKKISQLQIQISDTGSFDSNRGVSLDLSETENCLACKDVNPSVDSSQIKAGSSKSCSHRKSPTKSNKHRIENSRSYIEASCKDSS